jgi:RNA polymerase sigma-70 factor, ECF subfamily
MMEKPFRDDTFEKLVEAAQSGSTEDIGRILDLCRSYLLGIANQELGARGLLKVTASDVVQDTFLEAHRDFAAFKGKSEHRLRGWLRQMLLHNIADAYRRFEENGKRKMSREVDLTASANWRTLQQVPSQDPTPSEMARSQERDVQLEQALAVLPTDYRTVIHMHYREGHSFEHIASRTGRSVDAIRKLWLRGVKRLREVLDGDAKNERT